MKNNTVIFKACHALTRSLVKNTRFSYKATFAMALRLAYSDFPAFISSFRLCANDENQSIHFNEIAKISDSDFNIFEYMSKMDFDSKALANYNRCINFAVNYGLKKRDVFRSKKEILINSVSDNYNPIAVSEMRKNEIEDLKQDIAIYLLNRVDDVDFLALPNVYKLIRAGDCVVNNFCRKIKTEKALNSSLNELSDNEMQFGYIDHDFDKLTLDDFIFNISKNKDIPKIHRELAYSILKLRYTKNGEFCNKAMKVNEIALALEISERTVKSVLKDVYKLNPNELRKLI